MGDFNKKAPLVSIVVPAYNVQDYIEECIISLRAQTYQNIEIIIVDDGSYDRTGEICDSYAEKDARIRVIHQKNSGVTVARKNGLLSATGNYVSFVDADDWVESGMIEGMLDLIGDADLVSTGAFRERNKSFQEIRIDGYAEGVYEKEKMGDLFNTMIFDVEQGKLQPLTPWLWNKLFNINMMKEAYLKVDETLRFSEDAALVYAYILLCRKIVISHQVYYHYQYREDSAVHRVNEYKIEEVLTAYRSMKSILKDQTGLLFQLQKWLVAMVCCSINEVMGLDERIYIPEFIPDLGGLEGKHIILYGAGNVGKSYYVQMEKFGYDIIAWADKSYKNHFDKGVIAPEKIDDYVYDVILIAIESPETAEKIKTSLIKQGVQRDKIVWKAPFKIY